MNDMKDGLTVNGITPAEVSKFETLFMLLDAEGTGGINEGALADLMPRMGVFLSEDELHSYFMSVDSDGSGEIDFQEFLQLMSRHREESQLALLEGTASFHILTDHGTLRYVLRCDSPLCRVFDVLMLVTILFWISVATYDDVRSLDEHFPAAMDVKIAFSALLALDILRGLWTSRPADRDILPVDNPAIVRRKYISSFRFLVDALAALPLDLVFMMNGNRTAMCVAQHVRLLKVLVLPDLFRVSPSETLSSEYIQFHFTWVPLLRMGFWACFVVHILTVLWMVVSPGDVEYVEAAYFIVYTLTTTGYTGAPVETDAQMIFSIGLFFCASIVTGLVLGKLVQFSQQADLQTDSHRRLLETLAALNHLTIPQEFKEEVLAFQMHRLKHSNSLFNEAISGLPQVMQERMALYARMKIVRQVPIFAKAQEICVAKLAQSLVNVFVPPEEYIVIAGEEGEEMFFLFHGMCGVTRPDGKWVATIKRGGVFGEVALLRQTRRSASIKSLTYCQLFRLDKGAFESIVDQFPAMFESILELSEAMKVQVFRSRRTKKRTPLKKTEEKRSPTIPSLALAPSGASLFLPRKGVRRRRSKNEDGSQRVSVRIFDPVTFGRLRQLEDLADLVIAKLRSKIDHTPQHSPSSSLGPCLKVPTLGEQG